MKQLSKRKVAECKEHHLSCKCREKVFDELLMACQEALKLRGYVYGALDDWHFTDAERRDDERQICKIENRIRETIEKALKNNEIVKG